MNDRYIRGIRGATSVDENTLSAILSATRELLERIVELNGVQINDIASIIFTATPDLNAAPPARAAREMGWIHTPLMCLQEMAVENGLSRCIRILMLWNTNREIEQIKHVYLGTARTLRPDLINEEDYK
ncbi:MAG: chorismate mutase [Anaerolineales bacterium]|nr:chorismate mutase [Anaerolineales bacterium]